MCVCNQGTTGNPYEVCGAQNRAACSSTRCGSNAECREVGGSVECVCEAGYLGNPYVRCDDVDECQGNACGQNAVCINQPGRHDCRCRDGFVGNPFEYCYQRPANLVNCEKTECKCDAKIPCPDGFACKNGVCRDLCAGVSCGPNALCNNQGQCTCAPGYTGNPQVGCKTESCRNDLDCASEEICFTVSYGVRKCINSCTRIQCGPNALCVSENHRSACICQDGYVGNPTDLRSGCQLTGVREHTCDANSDCAGHFVCQPDINGQRQCVDSCFNFVCQDPNEYCSSKNGNPQCHCLEGYVRNPQTSTCEQPAFPDCTTDADCNSAEACKPDGLGVLRCTPVCSPVNCPTCNFISCSANAECVPLNHAPSCQCLLGFTGNPNDRNGCYSLRQDECSSDAQCDENEICIKEAGKGGNRCKAVCDTVKCGPGAVCVSNNHAAQCQCPGGGRYKGDPSDVKQGCVEVPCIYNQDCPAHQLCNRLTNKCMDVCEEDSCGTNAVCIAEKQKAQCICPSGFKPDPRPEIACTAVNSCHNNPCHVTAICESVVEGYVCKCPPGQVGDPIGTGCKSVSACTNDDQCPASSVCENGRCVDPCNHACGANSQCQIVGRNATCSCVTGFEGSGVKGCVRISKSCAGDVDCEGSLCIRDQCKVICRQLSDCAEGERCVSSMCMLPCIGHTQCPNGQACAGGFCVSGCRSNGECSREQSCINHQCISPCEVDGACGPNALCRAISHSAQCFCPDGFQGNPTAIEGCVRTPQYCSASQDCQGAGHICLGGMCVLSCDETVPCARGERCQNNICMKVCYTDSNCQAGEVCVEGVCNPGCRSDSDCKAAEVCISNKCRCGSGFESGPTGCHDINECDQNSCHPSAQCINTPGSFKCACPQGLIGDPYQSGCTQPHECGTNSDCPDTLACFPGPNDVQRCSDPCTDMDNMCGPRSKCLVTNHAPECICPADHKGDPYNKRIGCYPVECLADQDCAEDKTCDPNLNKCVNPCNAIACGKGTCQVEDHKAFCACSKGYEVKNNQCVDINECNNANRPCHSSAICQNTLGSFTCSCPPGMVGETLKGQSGCRTAEECYSDAECPDSAVCRKGKCQDACDKACGINAECTAKAHRPACRCPFQTSGDPFKECIQLECEVGNDCASDEACINQKCVNPCTLQNVCGQNTNCSAVNHQAYCSCLPEHYGDPLQGCLMVVLCNDNTLCPASSKCSNGICTPLCSSNRDCHANQVCLEGACQGSCQSDGDCPSFQICQNNICQEQSKCKEDTDCASDEVCRDNRYGQLECQHVCKNLVLCGRNAECSASDHQPICKCKEGFFGDPNDDRVGCQPIECQSNTDCASDKVCSEFKCQVACRVSNPCGENALCISDNHQSLCQCQPGFTGNPAKECVSINFCADKPCGPGAVCDNTRGSYKCLCPIGTVGDPYTQGCLPVPECKTDGDCPESTTCARVNGNNKCRQVCEGVKCGANAECAFKNHQSFCQCRQGYEGNPKDFLQGCFPTPTPCKSNAECAQNTYCDGHTCKLPCQGDGDCGPSEVCDRNQCVSPCEVPGSCGLNADCTTVFHNKQCACPPGFTGNAAMECVRGMIIKISKNSTSALVAQTQSNNW